MKLKIYFSIIFSLNFLLVVGQSESCFTPNVPKKPQLRISSVCGDPSNYAPETNYPNSRPIVTIKLNFHFMQKADGSGGMTETTDGYGNTYRNGYTYAQEIVDQANVKLANNQHNNLPLGNTTPVLPIKYRYVIYKDPNNVNDKGVYFHKTSNKQLYYYKHYDDSGKGMCDSVDSNHTFSVCAKCDSMTNNMYDWALKSLYGLKGNQVIDVFMIDDCDPLYDKIGGVSGVSLNALKIVNQWKRMGLPNGSWAWEYASLLNHEIGHTLGLDHPFDINQCGDVQGGSWTSGTNNMMDYNGCECALTPCQLGIQNYTLTNGTVPDYVLRDYCTRDPSKDLYITTGSNEVWNSSRRLLGNLIVTVNSSLTIKCSVGMPKNARIVVEPGGKLILDGGLITNLCGEMWQGVEVWGNSTQHQYLYDGYAYYQGFFQVKNGGEISNATLGVLSGNLNSPNSGHGGIIQVDNGVFRNNKKDVEFYSFQNFEPHSSPKIWRANVSYFKGANFITDAALNDGSFPTNHVTLTSIDGIRFYNCNFENSSVAPITNNNQLGIGIYSLDANFIVSGCSQGVCVSCCNYLPNKFTNLEYGVRAKRVSSLWNYQLDKSTFTNCVTGVLNEAVDNAIITRNQFTFGKIRVSGFLNISLGITINTGTKFRIEENNFALSSGSNSATYGIYVSNTGGDNNLIYRNTYNGLFLGNYATGQNRAAARDVTTQKYNGLAYSCNNNFYNTGYDFYVDGSGSSDGIREYQGSISNTGSYTQSAGNIFTNNANYATSDFSNNSPLSIVYVYDAGLKKTPLYYGPTGKITLTTAAAHTCPTNFSYGMLGGKMAGGLEIEDGKLSPSSKLGLINYYQQNNTAFEQYKSIYINLLDGGNTNSLVTDINNSWSDETWQLRQTLIGKSPYLSSDALKEASDKTTVLPDAMILEILAANPDALREESLLKYMLEKNKPLPEWMVAFLQQKETTITLRTFLESALSYHKAEKDWAALFLAQDILTNTGDKETVDHLEYRGWLATLKTVQGDYQIIDDFMQTDDITAATSLINSIPSLYHLVDREIKEYNSFFKLHTILVALKNTNRSINELTTSEIESLRDIVSNGEGIGKVRSCNLLSTVTSDACILETKLPNMLSSAYKKESEVTIPKEIINPTIRVFPNPAKDYVQLSYTLPLGVDEGELTITTQEGSAIYNHKIEGNVGQIAIDTRMWAQGSYLYSLSSGGKVTSNNKIVIVK